VNDENSSGRIVSVESSNDTEAMHGVARVMADLIATARGDRSFEYVPMDGEPVDPARLDVRAIAFYLPQFHPFPENDEWWGRGFTEWTNVSKAVPQFVGHYQPRLPGELGFYDLRVLDVMRRQVELACHYGIAGFCFHHYWFGGKRLMERPLQQFFDNKDIDFPFCVCWANENWTRRWDGFDQDVLIGQNHSAEDDLAFIGSLEPLLRDPRYIRVDGRPLVVLYRPSILPDAKATLERWRAHCRAVGIGELFLAMVQFDVEDPRIYGFDAAIEFPPHKLAKGLEPINRKLEIINPEYQGNVIEYGEIVQRARDEGVPNYDMIRGVFPSWDNEARKPGAGYVFANGSPRTYREWLDLSLDYARKHPVAGERLVFLNAWNEWAEGAYLEPDRRYGYAYLDQTRAALVQAVETAPPPLRRIVIVSHDAYPHGAQYLALHMARMFNAVFRLKVDVVLLGEGPLRDEIARWATVHDLVGIDPLSVEARGLARTLLAAGASHAIANTTVSGLFAKTLKDCGFRVISLIHELPGVIKGFGIVENAKALAASVDCAVFPSDHVLRGFRECTGTEAVTTVVRAQGLYKLNRFASTRGISEARKKLREKLDVPAESEIVLCVGYADHRKGIDLFTNIGKHVMQARSNVHFLWVGHFDAALEEGIHAAIREAGLEGRFHFPGIDPDTDMYYAGSDVYALTSREDPFPSVVMEALQVEVPVIGFAGTGGFVDLLERGTGVVVPAFDVEAFGNEIVRLLDDKQQAHAMGKRGRAIVDEEFDFRKYLFDLLDLLGCPLPRVSVIVPNYNYANHLRERIGSIVRQTFPFYELIVLDDASGDDSVGVLEQLAIEYEVPLRLVRNAANSGSVFRQWAKGVELARGEFVRIAEADDLSEPECLERLIAAMPDKSVVMAYCQSKQIDGEGNTLANTYLEYTNDVSRDHWLRAYRRPGIDEIRECLAIKNTIPNVSAALFRRDALLSALHQEFDTICSFRIAGDWVTYITVLAQGDIAFVPESLNLHRRHSSSVTLGGDKRPHMLEILRVQRIVTERYGLQDATAAKVARYNEHLRVHFGLSADTLAQLMTALGPATVSLRDAPQWDGVLE
jgi:glycosyltransferase involved in cell wall biosynthesis/GT2 family glycosyltransferase